jgi:hypothetical protein
MDAANRWLDRSSWGDVLATVGTAGSLQMVTAQPSRGTRYPPYLHPPVTASVFWAIALRVQEFDKGRGPVGFPADRAGL